MKIAKKDDTQDEEYWKILAKERINKELKLKEIHSKEDYQYALKEFFIKSKNGENVLRAGRFSSGRKRPGKITYDDISEYMYNGSKNDIIEQKKRKWQSLYRVWEAEYTHVSSKGKVYQQKQYQNIQGRFVANPFKS